MSDPINPQHYKHLPAEAIDIIDAAIEGAPSPQAAAAQSHLLGYALRANQKGQLAIDAGKAEWYAARWLKAIREAEAKAIPASETPIDNPSEEPDQDDHPHDLKVGDAVISWQGREGIIEAIGLIEDFPITVRHSIREQVSYKLGGVKKKHDDHPIETELWTPKIGERVIYTPSGSLWTVDRELKEKPRDGVTYILKDGTFTLRACLSRLAPIAPPKRYRDPTQADLRDGAIECEYRDNDDEQWRSGFLVYILNGSMPFLCTNKEERLSGQWNQCRIEAAE